MAVTKIRSRNINHPNSVIEEKLGGVIVGIDEAGRGSLVGPVIAAAVILPNYYTISNINDSKKLSKKKREILFSQIVANCHYGIGIASIIEIEQINILQATLLAMRRALSSISVGYDFVIVDGNVNPFSEKYARGNVMTVVKGDQLSLSIAAASIVAKVTRDDIMRKLHEVFPNFFLNLNNGYGTADHIKAIKKYGITSHHRKSFCKKIESANIIV